MQKLCHVFLQRRACKHSSGIGARLEKSRRLSVYKGSFLAGRYSSVDWKILSNDLLLFCFWKLVVASRYPKPLIPLEQPAKEVVSPETTSTFGTVKKINNNKQKSVFAKMWRCIRPAGCWFDRLSACLFWCSWHVLLQEIKVCGFCLFILI